MKYYNVVIDNKSDSTDNPFTYGWEGSEDDIGIGSKVFVPFANSKKPREGYVVSSADESEIDEKIKSKIRLIESIDDDVCLTEEMIRTSLWMRNRYLCRYIEAIRCFTPAGSRAVRRETPNPLTKETSEPAVIDTLTDEQQNALELIEQAMVRGTGERFLIHGVTGSGKTEVYIRAAAKALEMGQGVIVLVPEISLTGQVIERFLGRFGRDTVAVLHSKLNPGERFDQWVRIRKGEARIVIGARSAAFAPVENLGLVVVDEEHESTYKSDYTPKYDTVEVAMKRLQDRDNNGVLVLGTATPSVVTYSRAEEGIYRLIKLTKRYNEIQMPRCEIVDMRTELAEGNKSMISRRLASEMKSQLEAGRQVMLFLNRRGYSTFISCRECGYVARCPNCGLSLTYHRGRAGAEGRLTCHYCGHSEAAPGICPECGSRYMRYFGTGTEKVQEAVQQLFPDYENARVDVDSVKQKGELRKKLKDFEKGKTRILIGTQLIAKGLDFRNVGLVGIVSADVSLNIPDFRSPERAFQLITQAAGRAGRGDEEGHVIIQTYSPEHYAIDFASAQDYEGFYGAEIKFRDFMMYPPFSDIFQIVFTADSPEEVRAGAERWHELLLQRLEPADRENVFEPQEAYMSKIRNTYRYSMIVKCPRGNRNRYGAVMRSIRDDLKKEKKKYVAVVDVNPYSFM